MPESLVYAQDVLDAVAYAIDQNLAPVISLSYGLCELQTSRSDATELQSWAGRPTRKASLVQRFGRFRSADCAAGGSAGRRPGLMIACRQASRKSPASAVLSSTNRRTVWKAANSASGSSALVYSGNRVE